MIETQTLNGAYSSSDSDQTEERVYFLYFRNPPAYFFFAKHCLYLPLAGICLVAKKLALSESFCICNVYFTKFSTLISQSSQIGFLKVPNLDFSKFPTWISPPACCNCCYLCRAYCPGSMDPPRNL